MTTITLNKIEPRNRLEERQYENSVEILKLINKSFNAIDKSATIETKDTMFGYKFQLVDNNGITLFEASNFYNLYTSIELFYNSMSYYKSSLSNYNRLEQFKRDI